MQIFCVIEDAKAKKKVSFKPRGSFCEKKFRRPLFGKLRCLLKSQREKSSASLSETVIKALVSGSRAFAAARS